MDKHNAHQVHKYDVKNQIYLIIPNVFSKDVSEQTEGNKN